MTSYDGLSDAAADRPLDLNAVARDNALLDALAAGRSDVLPLRQGDAVDAPAGSADAPAGDDALTWDDEPLEPLEPLEPPKPVSPRREEPVTSDRALELLAALRADVGIDDGATSGASSDAAATAPAYSAGGRRTRTGVSRLGTRTVTTGLAATVVLSLGGVAAASVAAGPSSALYPLHHLLTGYLPGAGDRHHQPVRQVPSPTSVGEVPSPAGSGSADTAGPGGPVAPPTRVTPHGATRSPRPAAGRDPAAAATAAGAPSPAAHAGATGTGVANGTPGNGAPSKSPSKSKPSKSPSKSKPSKSPSKSKPSKSPSKSKPSKSPSKGGKGGHAAAPPAPGKGDGSGNKGGGGSKGGSGGGGGGKGGGHGHG